MQRIYLGKGVYRSVENTQLFEVFTDEQMAQKRTNTGYAVMKVKKQGGGFHGMKVLAKTNKHKRIGFENAELVTKEQLDIIKRTVGLIDPPQVEDSDVGESMIMQHDHSMDARLNISDEVPENISEGTNIGKIDPATGKPYEDDDHEPFDENFIGDDDNADDGHIEDESGTDGEDGEALISPEPTEPEPKQKSGGKPSGKSSKKSSQ